MENKNHMEHPSKTFMRPIAHIRSNFPSKFGIPRQSGIVTSLKSTIVFEPEFRNPEALRGLEEFSHIWLIWEFSQSARSSWSATVRPPRLGVVLLRPARRLLHDLVDDAQPQIGRAHV